jgi:biopolymer transport protein ExbD
MALDGQPLVAGPGPLLERVAAAPERLVRINMHQAAEVRHLLPLIAALEAAGAEEVALVVTPAGR